MVEGLIGLSGVVSGFPMLFQPLDEAAGEAEVGTRAGANPVLLGITFFQPPPPPPPPLLPALVCDVAAAPVGSAASVGASRCTSSWIPTACAILAMSLSSLFLSLSLFLSTSPAASLFPRCVAFISMNRCGSREGAGRQFGHLLLT